MLAYVAADRGYETPCHIWQGAHDCQGYRGVAGRRGLAHRVAYQETFGVLPPHLELQHPSARSRLRAEGSGMNEQGDIYFGENPPSVDVERLRAELESERREAALARMDKLLYAARTELWNQPEGRRR